MSSRPRSPLIGPFGESPFPVINTSGITLTLFKPIDSVIFNCVKLSPPFASTDSLYDSAFDLPMARIFSASALPVLVMRLLRHLPIILFFLIHQ